MARFLYSLFLYALSPLIVFYLYVIRGKKNAGYRDFFTERFAFGLKKLPKKAIVFHCASVGEVLAAAPLIKAFKAENSNQAIIVTCNTPTGRAQIKNSLPNTPHCYLPIDFWGASKRFINSLTPAQLVVLETELWPNLFAAAHAKNIAVNVVNARLSEKSLQGYQKVLPLANDIMNHITTLASHNEEDAKRFLQLGLNKEKVTVTGSIKFDINIDEAAKTTVAEFKKCFNRSKIWVAGSTHPGEHEQVLAAHQQVLETHPDALLIIAPRHSEQFAKVAELLKDSNLSFSKRSGEFNPNSQALLADTLGELKYLFGSANIAYIGGSLIERGGHNPLEAAAFSVGTLTGPHVYNFAHIYPDLAAHQGCITVHSSNELMEQINRLFSNPSDCAELGANALACLQKNQGAIAKTVNLISKHPS
jgi:3-deoxy-D-manno-octulosonic-acid transferase